MTKAVPIILGIDPGTLVVGYGAIVAADSGPRFLAAGVFRAAQSLSVPERLGIIRRDLDELLARVRPGVVAIEEAFHGLNPQSALRIGEGRGVALACAVTFGADVVQYPPAVAKKSVAGNGRASKAQVAEMVRVQLSKPDLEVPEDATDALALALTHFHRGPMASRLRTKVLRR